MNELKNTTQRARDIVRSYFAYYRGKTEGRSLFEIYEHFSQAKQEGLNYCLQLKAEKHGEGACFGGHNCDKYSYFFTFEENGKKYLAYITSANDYKISIDDLITQAQAEEEWKNAPTDNKRDKLRKIWRLASFDYERDIVSAEQYKMARRLYNAVRREWRLKDLELEYDSFCTEWGEKISKRYANADLEQLDKIKTLAQKLGLTLSCGTWAHIYANTERVEIM